MEKQYSNEVLLEALREACQDKDKVMGPTYQEYLKGSNKPSAEAIRSRFGGWTKAVREAGMIPGSRRTEEEMKTLVKLGKIDAKYVATKMGTSEQQLLSDLGLREAKKPTKERYIEEGVRIARIIGKIPAFHEFNRHTKSVTAWNPYRLYARNWNAFQEDIEQAMSELNGSGTITAESIPLNKKDNQLLPEAGNNLNSKLGLHEKISLIFNELVQTLKEEEKNAIFSGSQAFHKNEYDQAQHCASFAQTIATISKSIQQLYTDWNALRIPDLGLCETPPYSYNVNNLASAELSEWFEHQLKQKKYVAVNFEELLKKVMITRDELEKKNMIALSQLFSKLGFGIEPDIRFNSLFKSTKKAILFRLSSNDLSAPTSEYAVASSILHLSSMVSGADGNVSDEEEDFIERQIESWLHLTDSERNRLRAHSKWLIANQPNYDEARRKLSGISEAQKEMIGILLVKVAKADRYIEGREISILKKIYEFLQLNEEDLHKRVQSTDSIQTPNRETKTGVSIDTHEKRAANIFNDDLIKAKLAETAAVTALLSNIFIDEEEQHPVESQIDSTIPGLDTEQIAFAKVLIQKNEWSREDLEIMASESDLMLDGLLEAINEAAYDLTDQPFFEGDDPLEINQMAVKDLFNDSK